MQSRPGPRPTPQAMARKLRKSIFIGKGCFIQGLALIAPFVGILGGPVGIFIGLALAVGLFIYGSVQSSQWRCSQCMNVLTDKRVMICPVCRAQFGR